MPQVPQRWYVEECTFDTMGCMESSMVFGPVILPWFSLGYFLCIYRFRLVVFSLCVCLDVVRQNLRENCDDVFLSVFLDVVKRFLK